MFDFNSPSFENTVFNNANTGKVENVTMSVKLREPGTNQPHVSLIFTEENGSKVNTGIYINPKEAMQTEEDYEKGLQNRVVRRLFEAAKAVVPEGFVFQPVNSINDAPDYLINIINTFAPQQKVNVYVTYGTKERPSKYLSPRFYNFVEKAGTPQNQSKLVFAGGDNLEKFIEPSDDNTVMTNTVGTSSFTSPVGNSQPSF